MSTGKRFWKTSLGLAAAAVAAGALVVPGTALADRAALHARSLRAVAAAERQGYTCRNTSRVVNLGQGQGYVLSTTLFRNNSYKLIGVGDDSVRDLDLELYDQNWNLISRDTSTDNVPITQVVPRWTGTFYYKIVMYRGHGEATALICYKR